MAQVLGGNQIKLSSGKIVTGSEGGWFDGQQLWGGTLSQPGQIHPSSNQQDAGTMVSAEVNAQSAAQQGVSVQQFDQFLGSGIHSPVQIPFSQNAGSQFVSGLSAEVEKARAALEKELATKKAEADAKLVTLREKESQTLEKVGELTTPFREELETAERERLFINQNFEENQKLVDELDQLLTEGNELIRQQQDITGLAAIRNPRIQKAMSDVAARAGVIEAVINARNGQIGQAQNMIDRSVNAISQDRADQISYYNTILTLNRQDILSLDNDSKEIAREQLGLLKGDLERAQATADYVKQLMINPATASLMGEAGISLNDSVDQINSKLTQASYLKEVRDMTNEFTLEGATSVYDPSTVPSAQLSSFTDSRGQVHYFKIKAEAKTSTDSATDFLELFEDIFNTTGTSTKKTVAGPQFTPAGGVGAIWVDPKTGIIWEYTRQGWRML
jgi:hypothetical protein